MKKRILSLVLVVVIVATICSTAIATDYTGLEKDPEIVEGHLMSIYSEKLDVLVDATVYIYDWSTQAEATEDIYSSYELFQKQIASAKGANYGEWTYASRTVTCTLSTGAVLGYYNGFSDISTGTSGVQTSSTRARLYSQSLSTVSVSNTPVADSGSVTETYTNYVWAEASTSTSNTVKSAIGTYYAYQPGYNTFSVSLKASV